MACLGVWRVLGLLLLLPRGGDGVEGEVKASSCVSTEKGCPSHHLHCDPGATVAVQAARRVFNITMDICFSNSFLCHHNCCKNVTEPLCEPAVEETALLSLEQQCSGNLSCIVEIHHEDLYCGLLNNSKNVLMSYDSRIEYKCTPVPTMITLSTEAATTGQARTSPSPTLSTGFSSEKEDTATTSSTETEIQIEGTGHANSTRGGHPRVESQGYLPLILGGAVAGGTTLLLVCVLLVCWRKRRPSRGKMPDCEGVAVGNPAYEEGGVILDNGPLEDQDTEYDVLRTRKARPPAQPEGLYGHLGSATDVADDGVYDVTGSSKKGHVIDNVYDHALNVCSERVTDDACDVSTSAAKVKDIDVEKARDVDDSKRKDDVIESARDDITEHVYGNARVDA